MFPCLHCSRVVFSGILDSAREEVSALAFSGRPCTVCPNMTAQFLSLGIQLADNVFKWVRSKVPEAVPSEVQIETAWKWAGDLLQSSDAEYKEPSELPPDTIMASALA